MPKLLCFGDVHLGAGSEYGRRPGDRLRDQRAVLDQIAELAVDEAVDGVLIAGDVFNGPGLPPEQLDVFAHFIARLQMRIPALVISGNGVHDLAMRETNGLKIFSHIPGVQIASTPDVYRFAGCAVATLPWVSPARLVAARGGGDRDEIHAEVAQLLLDIAGGLREDCERVAPGAPHILLAHWSVSGSALPNGLPVDQLREPVIPGPDLDALGFDHVVLGHIHKQQRVGERGFYVGSPMPLNFGEARYPEDHGVVVVHTDETEDVDFYAAACHPILSRPLVTIDVDFTDGGDFTQILERYELDRWPLAAGAIVRLRYRATSTQQRDIGHQVAEVRSILIEEGASVVRVQPDIVREQRARVEGVDEHLTELAALDLYLDANSVDGQLADRMRTRLHDYIEAAA